MILVSFPKATGVAEVVEALGSRLERHVARDVPANGFERPWFAACRKVTETTIATAIGRLGGTEIGGEVARHRGILVNGLNIDFIAALGESLDVAATLAALPPDRVIVASGSPVHEALVETIGATGRQVTAISARVDAKRRATADAQGRLFPRTAAEDLSSSLEAAVRDIARTIGVPDVGGSGVICADFRNRRDFRYLATARAVRDAALAFRPVRILQQYNRVSRSVVRLAIDTALHSFGRCRVAFFRSPHALVTRFPPTAWARCFASEMERRALDDPDLASMLEAGPVARTAGRLFALRRLPATVAAAEAIRVAFEKRPPAWVVLVPDSQPFTMVIASGARAAGVPTIAVHTLLVGKSNRECRPTGEWIGCMDTSHARHLAEQFGVPLENIVPIGNIDVDDWRNAAERTITPAACDGMKHVVFVAQPLPGLTKTALEWLIAATVRRPDLVLDVYLHPDERHAQQLEYEKMAAAAGVGDRIGIRGRGTPMSVVVGAEVLATIDSNQGYKAGILGRKVLVVDPTEAGLPVSFDHMGIAVRGRSAEEVGARLDDLVDGRLDERLAASRAAFLAANPQLVSGSIGERVAILAERLAACHAASAGGGER